MTNLRPFGCKVLGKVGNLGHRRDGHNSVQDGWQASGIQDDEVKIMFNH